ncbi:MAG: Lar family restriction alleviation protein [Thermoanaerobaculia bacterium]|jgi:Lar family restriction alleviation protein
MAENDTPAPVKALRWRKKPVEIDAIQFDGTPAGANAVFDVFDIPGAKFRPSADLMTGTLLIPTLEGDHTASAGDWIIKGVKGEFYPCKPDIFVETNEPVFAPAPVKEGLMPCPFCGSASVVMQSGSQPIFRAQVHWIKCLCCGAESVRHMAMDVGRDAWNRRSPAESGEGERAILGFEGKINAMAGLLRDVRDILAYEADAFDSDRCADAVATIDEFMGWGAILAGKEPQ